MPFFLNIMFVIVPAIVFMGFILVFGLIIARLIQGAKESKRNNNSPELTVEATVVTKRTDVYNHHNNVNNNMHSSSSTIYYVTFEVESGDRMELKVQGNQYGMFIEGDKGKLTFQGTRYINFKRI